MANNPFPLSREGLLKAYRTMKTIREFEERVHIEFATGEIPGFVHLLCGRGSFRDRCVMHLKDNDRIARPIVVMAIASPRASTLEDDGRDLRQATGTCRGKGGSMHIADLYKGMMGANGISGRARPRLRRRAGRENSRRTKAWDFIRGRRGLESGHAPGEPEPGDGVESSGDLRRWRTTATRSRRGRQWSVACDILRRSCIRFRACRE